MTLIIPTESYDRHDLAAKKQSIVAVDRVPYKTFVKVRPLLFRGAPVPLTTALANGVHPGQQMRSPGPKRAFLRGIEGQIQPRYAAQKYSLDNAGKLKYRGLGGHLNGKARDYVSMSSDRGIAREFSMGNPDRMSTNPKRGGFYVLENVPAIEVKEVRKFELKAQRSRGILCAIKSLIWSPVKHGEHEFVSPEPIPPEHIVGYRRTRSKRGGNIRDFDSKSSIFLKIGLPYRQEARLTNLLTQSKERRRGRRPEKVYFDVAGNFYAKAPVCANF